jgi:SAM-dependent methyltransferase
MMGIARYFRHRLSHPLTRGMDIDAPDTTALRLQIIQSKPFLRRLYEEWYEGISSYFSAEDVVLELGSGAGFLRDWMPDLVTSDMFPIRGVDRVEDACALSFPDESLDGIVMSDVLHHIPDVDAFFREAARTLLTGGRIVMVEPWNNPMAAWVYRTLHHEPFDPDAAEWALRGAGPLSRANGALPWILTVRDADRFRAKHPQFSPARIRPIMLFAYLLSVGVSLRSLAPGFAYRLCRHVERIIGFLTQALSYRPSGHCRV